MIAICPAGPPKLMQPSFAQNQNASASLGSGAGCVDLCSGWPDTMGRERTAGAALRQGCDVAGIRLSTAKYRPCSARSNDSACFFWP
jgi:hypothetical protein